MVEIGKLERVSLREVWPHEQYDFTTWLQDNLDVLNDYLPFELDSAEREASAGAFNVDLVAEDSDSKIVVIENQLGQTDHDHLGKVITYLSALDAERAIWICAKPRPEHTKAVAWLNDSSSAEVYLFKIDAIRIGDSEPALSPNTVPLGGPLLPVA